MVFGHPADFAYWFEIFRGNSGEKLHCGFSVRTIRVISRLETIPVNNSGPAGDPG